MILSYGTSTSDIDAALGLDTAINKSTPTQRDQNIINLCNAIEGDIRLKTGRTFSQQTLSDEPSDVRGATKKTIILADRPVQTWTSIKEVLTRDSSGDPENTYTVPRNDYLVYMDRGRIKRKNGYWKEGFQVYLVSAIIGHTSTQIADNSTDDIRIFKELVMERLSQIWHLMDKGDWHVSGKSFKEGTIQLEKNWTKGQKDLLFSLKQGHL